MEIREIFRVVAKWLDNNLVTKFRMLQMTSSLTSSIIAEKNSKWPIY